MVFLLVKKLIPAARLASSDPPFSHVGVDYFGPLPVQQGRSHVMKYDCLLTCLVIQAVHIEIAHKLESDSFLCAYRIHRQTRMARQLKYSVIMALISRAANADCERL